jgi:hypothetical protein
VLLVAASLTAGVGQGIAFRLVFNDVAGKVEASRHAQIISTVYVITYLGSAVPVVGLGLAASVLGLGNAASCFTVVCGLASMVLAAVSLRRVVRKELAPGRGGSR